MTRNIRTTRTPAPNSGLEKVAVSFSADTFTHLLIVLNGIRDSLRLIVVNQSLVLRINPPEADGENRQLLVAANLYAILKLNATHHCFKKNSNV
jgi:hypothetical protein